MNLTAKYKSRIAKQFSRAAHTYNSAADVQLDIAFDGLNMLPSGSSLGLDIGCGTGRISQQLIAKCNKVIAMDLAYGMLEYAKQESAKHKDLHGTKSIQWLQGDAEQLPIADKSVDLVFSSMALQWCSNEFEALSEISRVMKPGATAILGIMCAGSFHQLNDSWLEVDEHRHTNEFKSASCWYEAAKAQELLVTTVDKEYITWHQDIRGLLASIKSIGANVVLPKINSSTEVLNNSIQGLKALNRDTIARLELAYQMKYSENSQLPLSYQISFLRCVKP
ncbi:methyltransferase domain-containing protein [Paraglaciecola sp. 2405UD69-4]|uniref:methyltransferase domain-containing protein n=1 Tax=Paraglaciecola sp. 2405UD69-4 TaxID=3391836 RepID=UPI0039C96BC9